VAESFKPRTQYVAGRLRQTAWPDRRVIRDLMVLENFFSGCPCGGLHSLWVRRGLMTRYQVEAVIIREELRVGVQLTEEEAQQWLRDEDTAQLAHDEARRARQRAERDQMEREAFQEWLSAGGLP
jgi:hypothetical protein